MRRSFVWTALTLVHVFGTIAGAQQPTDRGNARAPRFLIASSSRLVPVDVSQFPLLGRRLSLELDGATLKQALGEISHQSGLRLVYSDDVLPHDDRRVQLRAEGITVVAALTDVLFDAGVDIVFSRSGGAALVRRTAVALPVQTGVISGHVTDSISGQGIGGVAIAVEATRLSATTAADGGYTIRGVPAGNRSITARRLGYAQARRTANIEADQEATVDFVLTRVAAALEEVITTVTGEQRKLEVGNSIGTIQAENIVRDAPIRRLADLINARVPGVQVVENGGFTGGSARIRIRGLNSASVSNDPLLYVDGIRVDNSNGSQVFGFGQRSGRFNDINPNEIQSVEIVKGPSAATLYGTDAANGVILITTKRGQPGRAKWNGYVQAGTIRAPSLSLFPNNYFGWGRNTTTGAVQKCVLAAIAAGTCVADSLARFSPFRSTELTPLGSGSRTTYGLQVGGGVSQFTYFLSADLEREIGYLRLPALEEERISVERGGISIPDEQRRPNALRKVNLRANVGAALGTKGEVAISTGFVSSSTQMPNPFTVFLNGIFAPGNRGTRDGWGAERPGETFSVRNSEEVSRYIASLTANWRPKQWITARATVGGDFSGASLDALQRRDEGPFGANRLGRRLDSQTAVRLYTGDMGALATYGIRSDITAKTAVGLQYNRQFQHVTTVTGTNLPPGSESVAGAAVVTGSEQTLETVVAGAYAEQSVGLKDRLFLTAAL
jgi:TonB-dependent SusC/RagA subfamily outer membrane receptor